MAGISLTVKAKKVMNFICLPNFHGEQQHFNITNIKLRYYFRGESFFSDKVNLKKASELFILPRYTKKKLRCEDIYAICRLGGPYREKL